MGGGGVGGNAVKLMFHGSAARENAGIFAVLKIHNKLNIIIKFPNIIENEQLAKMQRNLKYFIGPRCRFTSIFRDGLGICKRRKFTRGHGLSARLDIARFLSSLTA
jgi:hypothetical protein